MAPMTYPARLLHVAERGDGDPLVLIHGAGTSHQIWRRVLAPLGETRRAIAIDVPGYGASPPIGRGFRFADVADRIAAGLEQIAVPRPFDLVGHSLGGALAIVLAARHPERIGRLVLVAPAGLAASPPGVAPLLAMAAAPFARLRRSLAIPLAGSPAVRRVALAGVARDGALVPAEEARAVLRSSSGARRLGPGLAAAARAVLTAELAALPLPVGFVWGAHDPVIPNRRIEVVRALRPEAPIRIVASSAHAPMLEHPEQFLDALGAVFSSLAGAPAATAVA
jgi:pimeloyl-ACP methyl ester carboxylesterase